MGVGAWVCLGSLPNHHITLPTRGGVGLFGVVVFFWCYPFLTTRPQGSVDVISLYPLPDPQGSVGVISLYPLPDPQKISRIGGVP